MLITAVLTQQVSSAPTQGTARYTLIKMKEKNISLVRIIWAVKVTSYYLEGFINNTRMVTISDEVFPLYLV